VGVFGQPRSGYPTISSLINTLIDTHPTHAAATRLIIDAQDGPVVLVGHSYGGAVITEAGTDQNVAALVYIAAFAPDQGESVNTLIADPPPGAPAPPILPPTDGFLFLDRDKFHASFTGDLPAEQAAFMADSQVPWGVDALNGSITEPAWRDQAELVPAGHRRPDDSPAGVAFHVRAGRCHGDRGRRQPLRIPLGPAAVAALIEQAATAAAAR
jgi:pimeloyl-ACP methyl ester carboxylesterase